LFLRKAYSYLCFFHGSQEKEREKKHKKEKRDKEKREGKEKREKDRSDGKHKEKKDKKEKNRDKKKDKEKDRDKDKEKNSAPDEKRLVGQAEGHTGEKLIQKEERDKGKNSISEKRFVGQFPGYNAEKISDSSRLAKETIDSKFMQELGRRIKDDDRATENKMVEKFTNTDRKKDEEMAKLLAKGTGTWTEGKEKNRKNDDRKMDGQGISCEARFSGNSMVQNPVGVFQTRVEGMLRPFERKVEEKEKTKEKEGDDRGGDKRKDKDREKKSQGKDKDRDKEKKKEKSKAKIDHKNTEHDRLKESNKSDLIASQNIKTPQPPKDGNKKLRQMEFYMVSSFHNEP